VPSAGGTVTTIIIKLSEHIANGFEITPLNLLHFSRLNWGVGRGLQCLLLNEKCGLELEAISFHQKL